MDVGIIFIAFMIGLGLLLIGIPIGVVMVLMGTIGGVIVYGPPFIGSIGSVVWGVQNENILTAVPLFILMGELLLRTGVADGMYKGLSVWFRRLPGGLIHTNIGCSALFAATTGSSVACAATIGNVALPELDKRGYSKRQALGSLAAGGTLGILIPPSIALLIYGGLTNNSISKLFVAGVIPGILLTLSFMLYILIINIKDKSFRNEPAPTWRERMASLPLLIPPLVIFLVVMGSIYFGIATPTESAALGIMTALLFAIRRRKLTLKVLHSCFVRSAQLTGMILLIIVGAFILNLLLSLVGVAQVMTKWVISMNLSLNNLLLILIVFYLILGCFLDVLSIQVATIPIAYPIVTAVGGDPIWFGIFIVLMSEIGMITPPVGMNLFVIQGVRRDGGDLADTIWGAVPFVFIMMAFTLLLIVFPEIVLWLPSKM
ncbi:MAG: TRAP transporter large permease [Desulfobacterales bacterium]|nr:TRAP transporter large permease [Desulfobacterales bacterium]